MISAGKAISLGMSLTPRWGWFCGGVLPGCGNGAEAEARDSGRGGVWKYLEGAEDFGRGGSLVAEAEDEDAGLDLFGREQAEAACLLTEFHL